MTIYGVLPAGFVKKTIAQIQADMEATQKASMDSALDTSAAGHIGQLNGIAAAQIGELWDVGEAAYNSFNPDLAVGQGQDNLGAVRGSKRLTDKASSVPCDLVFSAPGTYAAGTLVANVAGTPGARFSNGLDVVVPALDSLGHPTAFPYAVPGAVFVGVALGPTVALAGTLTTITAPVNGWSSVTNPLDATLGHFLESDADYQQRQQQEIAAAGACTVPSVVADLLDLGATSASVIENIGDGPDANGQPGHSSQAIVYDALDPIADADIGLVVWNNKPSGARTFGSTSVDIVDQLGVTRTVSFTRPTERPVYMAFTITLAPGLVLGTIAPLMKQTIVNYSRGLDVDGNTLTPAPKDLLAPGVEVDGLAFVAAIYFGPNRIPGVTIKSYALDFSPSPTSDADLPIGTFEVGVLDSSRIAVNGI
jgi:hypothetical protein